MSRPLGVLAIAALSLMGMAEAASLTGTKRRQWWESLSYEERARITAAHEADKEKRAEEFEAARQAEYERYVEQSKVRALSKQSGMTGKAFRRMLRKGRRLHGNGWTP